MRARRSAPACCWAASRLATSFLCDPHIPENRRGELESALHILSECRRLEPFSPRNIGDFAQGNLLNFLGDLLAFRRIGRAYPVGCELVELRDVGPPEPRGGARTRHTEMDGRTEHVCCHPPRMQEVPAALLGGFLARAKAEVRRPVRCLEDDVEADRLQSLTRDKRRSVHWYAIGDVEHNDGPAVVARLLHELSRSRQVVFDDRFRSCLRCVGTAAREDGMTRSVIFRGANGQGKICHLVHHVEESLARLPVAEWRLEMVRPQPALRAEGIEEERL